MDITSCFSPQNLEVPLVGEKTSERPEAQCAFSTEQTIKKKEKKRNEPTETVSWPQEFRILLLTGSA